MNKQVALFLLIMPASCFGIRNYPEIEAVLQKKLSHQQQKMRDLQEVGLELKTHLIEMLGYSEQNAVAEVHRLLVYSDPRAQFILELAQLPREELNKLPKSYQSIPMAMNVICTGPRASVLEEQVRLTRKLYAMFFVTTIPFVDVSLSSLEPEEVHHLTADVVRAVLLLNKPQSIYNRDKCKSEERLFFWGAIHGYNAILSVLLEDCDSIIDGDVLDFALKVAQSEQTFNFLLGHYKQISRFNIERSFDKKTRADIKGLLSDCYPDPTIVFGPIVPLS